MIACKIVACHSRKWCRSRANAVQMKNSSSHRPTALTAMKSLTISVVLSHRGPVRRFRS